MSRPLCTYCGHNPSCITIDDTEYCSWDCMTDDYEAEQRKLRREQEEKNR